MTIHATPSAEFGLPFTPAPGMVDASTDELSAALVKAQVAVNRARLAQPAWKALGARRRAAIIENFRRLLYRAARVRRTRSQTMAAWRKTIITHYEPSGVVAVVSPWNFPFFFPAMHVMTALVAGNAVVRKPSDHSPRCGDELVRLLHSAGVPEDVLILLQGDGRTGAALVSASVDKVLFTGSDAAILLDDANMGVTASGILWNRFSNAGQTCVAVKRVIAVGRAYDALLPLLKRGVESLTIDANTSDAARSIDMGPMISAAQRTLIMEQLNDAIARGATVVARSEPRSPGDRMAPAVLLTNVTPAMRVWSEETFGPVLVIMRASSEAEAIALANSTRYGLSGSVWSADRARARRIALQLDTGTVVINDAVVSAGLPEIAHGGVKASGMGRIHGEDGLLECVRTRVVVDDLLTGMRQAWWFGYGPESAARLDAYVRLSHGRSWSDRLSGIAGTIKMLLRPEKPL